MTDDERIENLLDRWETAAEKGNELAAEELCQDCPHLTVRLLEEIRALRATEWLRQSSQINRSRPTLAEGTSREAKRPGRGRVSPTDISWSNGSVRADRARYGVRSI